MAILKYVVEVTVERESGKFAGRDEISEKIVESFERAVEDADLSGLGADSNSEYTVEDVSIREADSKELRALWKESEDRAADERLTPTEAEKALRVAKAQISNLVAEVEKLRSQASEKKAEELKNATRVFLSDGLGKVQFLPDGRYDSIGYSLSDGTVGERTEAVTVSLRGQTLEVRNNLMRGQLAVVPVSSNEVHLKLVER